MGGGLSRNKKSKAALPPYGQPGSSIPPYNISRPSSPSMAGVGGPGSSPYTRKQQRELEDAYRKIQKLQTQIAMQSGGGYMGGPPITNLPPPILYSSSPTNQIGGYPPPSPLLQRFVGQSSFPYQQQIPMGNIGIRDTDYAAVANISGLNPNDVALLHREYINLTRGGTNKLDRVIFRQLLREAMIEANNENVDRAIENVFVSIDRNHDGFIDFPEFIGAFRDILKGSLNDPQSYLSQNALPNLLINEQLRANSNVLSPLSHIQQSPIVYNGTNPLVISLDSNQTPYAINSQGQSIMTQPTSLQCVPLPI